MSKRKEGTFAFATAMPKKYAARVEKIMFYNSMLSYILRNAEQPSK